MIRDCPVHGYFRGETCPTCGEKGKFLMNDGEMDSLGRTLAGILRHFPERFDLDMDDQGWVNLDDIVYMLKKRQRRFHWLQEKHIIALMDTDDKGRYQHEEGYVRATYGHSIDLDIDDLPTDDIPDKLYYPTTEEEVDIVLETGLNPSDRTMVHLSKTVDKALEAGRVRVEDPVILEVDAAGAIEDGELIMRAGTTVYVAKGIYAQFLRKMSAEEVEENSTPVPRDEPEESEGAPEDDTSEDADEAESGGEAVAEPEGSGEPEE